MKTRFKNTTKFLKRYPDLSIRFVAIALTFFLLISLTVAFHFNNTYAINSITYNSSVLHQDQRKFTFVPEPEKKQVTVANEIWKIETAKKIEIEKLKKEREEKINRVLAFLSKQKSPVANYDIAALIIDGSQANNADYRVVVAIMGIESGFCRASFWYNCFGYLNGVKYSSYYSAFQDIVPKVSRQYAARYGWDFVSLAKAYGMINWQHASANLKFYANSI